MFQFNWRYEKFIAGESDKYTINVKRQTPICNRPDNELFGFHHIGPIIFPKLENKDTVANNNAYEF